MNTKTLVAGLLAAIVTFLIGWLIFGVLLVSYYNSNMLAYPGLLKEPPNVLFIGFANLAWGLMLAYVFSLAGINTASKGLITGFIIFLLICIGFNCMFHAQFNLYSRRVFVVDALANGVLGAISGAFIGWWYGRK